MTNNFKPKIYFIKDAEQIIGRNRLTLRRWWGKNSFPRPTLINNRLAWHAETIDQWINQQTNTQLEGEINEKLNHAQDF